MVGMSGQEMKAAAEAAGLSPIDVCGAANVSIATLYKVYNGEHVRATTRAKVEQAIKRLRSQQKAAVAG
jgi:DNA-binding LacI/PurR family transcriptional regulator